MRYFVTTYYNYQGVICQAFGMTEEKDVTPLMVKNMQIKSMSPNRIIDSVEIPKKLYDRLSRYHTDFVYRFVNYGY